MNFAWPGITFDAPGLIDISPTVTTVFAEAFAIFSNLTMHSLAVTRRLVGDAVEQFLHDLLYL